MRRRYLRERLFFLLSSPLIFGGLFIACVKPPPVDIGLRSAADRFRNQIPSAAVARRPSVLPGLAIDVAAETLARAHASVLVARMDLPTAAAQTLMTAVKTRGLTATETARLREIPVGGVMLFKYNLGAGVQATVDLARDCQEAVINGQAKGAARIAPFIAVDHEGGYVHRLDGDATHLPSAAAFGALLAPDADGDEIQTNIDGSIGTTAAAGLAAIRGAAYRSGRELSALGIDLNLAPVAETAVPGDALFNDQRSYTADPLLSGDAAAAFALGMADAGIGSAVKHFPGSSAADPHKGMVVVAATSAELRNLIAPFRRLLTLIQPAAIMVSHAVIKTLDDIPGSLSRTVVSDLLKTDLGFRGIAVADDFRMAAIAATGRKPAEAAVEALIAGIDLVLVWPDDLIAVHAALIAAVADGRLPHERLYDAATRIVTQKLRFGFTAQRKTVVSLAEYNQLRVETEAFLQKAGLR